MATARSNRVAHLSRYVIRPALAEARLLNAKHANDPVYLGTIAEELRNVEKQVASLEESLHLQPSAAETQPSVDAAATDLPGVAWIHAKSTELGRRMRQIEEMST